MHQLPNQGFLRLPQIIGSPGNLETGEPPRVPLFPVSRSTWWAGVKSGRFPSPVKLGPRTTAWRASDIRELIERASAGGALDAA